MEKWIYAINANCVDATKEKEFNDWYNEVHIPDILETQGFLSATRYENREPSEGQGKFLTLYEIETDDIDKTMAILGERSSNLKKQGRGSSLISVVSRTVYKKIR
ncbi:DUF4286 family protein [Chloroflexota bacterium]